MSAVKTLSVTAVIILAASAFLGGLLLLSKYRYDEANDPDRDYYITRENKNLECGEIYEKEFIPAHTETKTKTVTEWGYGYGFYNGDFGYGYGLHTKTVPYEVDVPDLYLLKIFTDDTERLIYFVSDIEVSESAYNDFDVGDFYGERGIEVNSGYD